MKLIPVVYYGFTAMDRRFSSPMLPWIVSEIRKRDYSEQISLGVENGILQAYNPDFELQFSHKINQITRFSQADQDPTTFLYLMRDDGDTLLYCYLFQAKKVSEVMHTIDEILDPVIKNIQTNQTALDFLENFHHLNIIPTKQIKNFLNKIKHFNMENYYNNNERNTYFIPINSDNENVDINTIMAHIIKNNVLFTRPVRKQFFYETLSKNYISLQFLNEYLISTINADGKQQSTIELIKTNIPIKNGVIHLINQTINGYSNAMKQLTKPFPYLSVFYKLSTDPFLDITYKIGELTGVNEQLKNQSLYITYFAPKNSAWTNWQNLKNLQAIIKRHLIISNQQFFNIKQLLLLTNELNELILNTLNGPMKFKILQNKNGGYFLKWRNKTIGISRTDYLCTNGVLHIIDEAFIENGETEEIIEKDEQNGFWRLLKKIVAN